jgi:cysteine desulfurase
LIPGSQEGHRRGGTESLPAIVAMGAAADVAIVRLADWDAVREQRDWLEAEVTGGGPGWVVYGMGTPRLPNTSCLGVPTAATGGAVVAALDLDGFAVSSGSACSSGVERASPVVEAMGYGREAAQRSLRITLGRGTGREACRALAGALHEIVRREAGGLP